MNVSAEHKIDISIFKVPSQTSPQDKEALEIIRMFLSKKMAAYKYIELGSYLGGTLLPHLVAPECSRILSIDKRVSFQPDERSIGGFLYDEKVTTRDLMEQLAQYVGDCSRLNKLETHDGVISDLEPESVMARYKGGFELCFIDAEHTNEAVFSDFLSVIRLVATDSIIVLHDSWLLGTGIKNIMQFLHFQNVDFCFMPIKGSVSAFFLGKYSKQDQLYTIDSCNTLTSDDYFAQANRMLWAHREKDIIKSIPVKVLLKQVASRILKYFILLGR